MRSVGHRFVIPLSAAIAALGFASGVPALAGHRDAARTAQDRVSDAASLVHQMKQDPALAAVLQQARGVFIIPHYGRGGFIVGAQDGSGVVLVKHANAWSSPAFYNLSGGSIGAQAGGEGGAVAMILMSQKAVDHVESPGSGWSLSGNAGLTVATWSGSAQAKTRLDDVILWSNTRGLYGGLTASITHISSDTAMDRTYYRRPVKSGEILSGNVSNPNADPLRDALAARVASR
jgi:lipid-binding SYLF domain-containing protein